jgi:dihydroxyacetone kinase
MFRLEDDEFELGLGIHGEAGVKRIQVLFFNINLPDYVLVI